MAKNAVSDAASEAKLQPATVEEKQRLRAMYNEVVDRAILGAIRLVDLSFSIKSEYLSKENYTTSAAFKYGVSTKEVDFDAQTGRGGASFICEAHNSLGRVKVVHCKATYFVGYSNMSGCDETAAKAFMGRVGRFTCYPYFRSLVATLDWNSRAGLPILPVLKEPLPGARGEAP